MDIVLAYKILYDTDESITKEEIKKNIETKELEQRYQKKCKKIYIGLDRNNVSDYNKRNIKFLELSAAYKSLKNYINNEKENNLISIEGAYRDIISVYNLEEKRIYNEYYKKLIQLYANINNHIDIYIIKDLQKKYYSIELEFERKKDILEQEKTQIINTIKNEFYNNSKINNIISNLKKKYAKNMNDDSIQKESDKWSFEKNDVEFKIEKLIDNINNKEITMRRILNVLIDYLDYYKAYKLYDVSTKYSEEINNCPELKEKLETYAEYRKLEKQINDYYNSCLERINELITLSSINKNIDEENEFTISIANIINTYLLITNLSSNKFVEMIPKYKQETITKMEEYTKNNLAIEKTTEYYINIISTFIANAQNQFKEANNYTVKYMRRKVISEEKTTILTDNNIILKFSQTIDKVNCLKRNMITYCYYGIRCHNILLGLNYNQDELKNIYENYEDSKASNDKVYNYFLSNFNNLARKGFRLTKDSEQKIKEKLCYDIDAMIDEITLTKKTLETNLVERYETIKSSKEPNVFDLFSIHDKIYNCLWQTISNNSSLKN